MLRRQQPASSAGDWLAGILLAAVAVVVIGGVWGAIQAGDGEPTGAGPTGTADGTDAAGVTSPDATTAAATTEPTAPPTPTPTPTAPPTPTPTPTPPPTPSPTPPPTPPPTPTEPPTPSPPPTPTAAPPTAAATAPPTATPMAPPQALVILEPEDGTVVGDRSIIVRGMAPPRATVTRDIPFWFDEHTRADSAGRWSFAVELLPGDNKLTFRIGDEPATSQSLTVRYDPN